MIPKNRTANEIPLSTSDCMAFVLGSKDSIALLQNGHILADSMTISVQCGHGRLVASVRVLGASSFTLGIPKLNGLLIFFSVVDWFE
ncbi:MAG: hypothetical protein VKK05_08950 [Synechococcus sp.]|nr:hypothetical protein [Synechococcus sp.]